MSKFTRKQRRKIYKKALMGLLEGNLDTLNMSSHKQINHSGLCELISLSAYGKLNCISERNFPEFFLFEPTDEDIKEEYKAYPNFVPVFWWLSEDREVRKICLLLCIEMTKKKYHEMDNQDNS